MAGPANENHVQVVFLNEPIEMRVNQVQARRRAPMAQQPGLNVIERNGSRRRGLSNR